MRNGLRTAAWIGCLLAMLTSTNLGAPAGRVAMRVADQQARDVPVTFAQVFKKGDIRQDVQVVLPGARTQVDVKRRYEDGSVRFAVVSMLLDQPAPRLEVSLTDGVADELAKPTPVGPADLLKTDFDAVVRLRFPDGAERSASARAMLETAGAKARTWLAGPVVAEWLLEGAPADKQGRADEDLRVQFHVRAYAGCRAVRVTVVVENCLDTWAGNIGYDVEVAMGRHGWRKKGVNHRRLSRWRMDFWWPEAPRRVEVAHDLACLIESRAIPNYDRSIAVPESTLADLARRWMGSGESTIMGSGSLTRYMPTTGGRAEIGPYPRWTVEYLLSMDERAKAVVLGNGDLAGSWPIHVRNSKTGRILTLDERPKFWINGYRDGDRERPLWRPDRTPPPPPRTPDGKAHPYYLSPDVAHMGSYAYVPYLVTGDYYYLEEAYFWANYVLLAQWPVPRQDSRGLLSDQIRGNAWGLRNIADAASIAPDGEPEGPYFNKRIRENLAEWTKRMYGPPEYNKMGFWGIRTVGDARIQNPANPRWMVTAPWEHDFLIWSLHHLTELGWAEAARPRDFELRWRVGAFVHPTEYDPRLGAPYRMAVGEMGPDKKVTFYEDWATLGRENAKLTQPPKGKSNPAHDYSAHIALVSGVDAGFPGAQEALKVLLELTGGYTGYLADPAWRIVPRKAD